MHITRIQAFNFMAKPVTPKQYDAAVKVTKDIQNHFPDSFPVSTKDKLPKTTEYFSETNSIIDLPNAPKTNADSVQHFVETTPYEDTNLRSPNGNYFPFGAPMG